MVAEIEIEKDENSESTDKENGTEEMEGKEKEKVRSFCNIVVIGCVVC